MDPAPVSDTGGLGYQKECNFGDCGMKTIFEDEKISFSFPLRLLAKKLQIANTVVLTKQFLGHVVFSCEYSTEVNVSNDFESQVMETTMKGKGQLAQGFKMMFNDNRENNVKLGGIMKIEIQWSVQLKSSIII